MRLGFLLGMVLALAGCSFFDRFAELRGAPDGSLDGDGSTQPGAPAVRIDFPPSGVTGATSITMRGSVVDLEGDAIAEVRVGDAVADVDADGSWSVQVLLDRGENVLTVSATDAGGATDPAAASVTLLRKPLLHSIVDLEIDMTNGRLVVLGNGAVASIGLEAMEIGAISDAARGSGAPLVEPTRLTLESAGVLLLDELLPGVVAVAAATGNRSTVSDASTGTGDALGSMQDLAFDSAGSRVLVANSQALVGVSRSTGNRTIVASSSVGTGGSWQPKAVAMDTTPGSALVVDYWFHALWRVDLATGNHVTVSDTDVGTGPTCGFGDSYDLAIDAANGRVLLPCKLSGSDPARYALLSVDLDDGNRTLFSGPTADGTSVAGEGPLFVRPGPLVVDTARNRALMIDPSSSQLFAIDLATGDRTVALDLRAPGAGAGEPDTSGSWDDVAIDAEGDRALVAVSGAGRILAIDLDDGARTLLSGTSAGDGPELVYPRALAIDAAGHRALVADFTGDLLMGVALDTGSRTVVADGPTSGAGELFGSPEAVTVDAPNGRLLFIASDEILSMGLATGTRTEFSGDVVGSGAAFAYIADLAVDAAHDRVLVAEECVDIDCTASRLLAVDLASGNRAVFSDATHGSGQELKAAIAIAVDGDRALVSDTGLRGVLAVDLESGDRTMLARPGLESGVPLGMVHGLAVEPVRRWALLTEISLQGLVVMDLSTGETVALSY